MKVFMFILSFSVALFGVSVIASALDYNADLSLSAAEQYNDNIFLSHTDRIGDYSTVITPAVAISTTTEKINAMLNYSPSFTYYNSHSELNSISHQASANGSVRLSEVATLAVADSFVRTKDALIIRSIVGSGPVTRNQETITTNTLSGNLLYKLTEQLSLQPSLTYTMTDNSDSDIANLNNYSGGLLASYLLTGRTTLRASATYTVYDYSIGSDYNGQDYILGLNHKFTPTITVDIYGGVDMTQIRGQGDTDTGFIGGLSATKTLERGSVSIAYTQAVTAAIQNSSPLKSQILLLHYAAPVTAFLEASLSASYGHYRAIGLNTGPDQKRTETVGTAGLSYRLLPWANLTLSYSYVNSNDKVDKSGSYSNNVIVAGIRLSKQARF